MSYSCSEAQFFNTPGKHNRTSQNKFTAAIYHAVSAVTKNFNSIMETTYMCEDTYFSAFTGTRVLVAVRC